MFEYVFLRVFVCLSLYSYVCLYVEVCIPACVCMLKYVFLRVFVMHAHTDSIKFLRVLESSFNQVKLFTCFH